MEEEGGEEGEAAVLVAVALAEAPLPVALAELLLRPLRLLWWRLLS